jgi:hypothetical protein
MAPPPPKFAMTVENAGAARKISFHWRTCHWHLAATYFAWFFWPFSLVIWLWFPPAFLFPFVFTFLYLNSCIWTD